MSLLLLVGHPVNAANPPLPRVAPVKPESLDVPTKPEPINETFAKEIAEMQQKFQAVYKAPVSWVFLILLSELWELGEKGSKQGSIFDKFRSS